MLYYNNTVIDYKLISHCYLPAAKINYLGQFMSDSFDKLYLYYRTVAVKIGGGCLGDR